MSRSSEIGWIQLGIVAGLAASAFYPLLVFAPLPRVLTGALAAFLGPAIGLGSLGLFRLIRLHGESMSAGVGAICNFAAGILITAMLLVQIAVGHLVADAASRAMMQGVWLGLDVAWDVYIGLGTIAFGWSMLSHPRFRWPFGASGLLLGGVLLVLNLATFPTPPAEAGSFDVGPVVGLWYLATTLRAWSSLRWARERARALELAA